MINIESNSKLNIHFPRIMWTQVLKETSVNISPNL